MKVPTRALVPLTVFHNCAFFADQQYSYSHANPGQHSRSTSGPLIHVVGTVSGDSPMALRPTLMMSVFAEATAPLS